jgi:fused signal recognition particle receptor
MLGWFKKKKKTGAEAVPGTGVTPSEEKQPAGADTEKTPAENISETTQVISKDDAVAVKQAQELEQADQKGLYQRLQERLKKTRDSFVSRVDTLFLGKKEIDAQLLDELEEILITADLGVNTTMDLLDEIRQKVSRKELSDPQAIKFALKERILSFFEGYDAAGMQLSETGPFVIMVVGVNGVGKTTTIGKIAYKFASSGQRVLLIAADTFRAAAIEQLQVWGERVGAEVVARKQGADPSSVIYDGLDFAAAKDFDVIIIDTAGRLHTKVNLMEELKKIKRVVNKKIAGAPHEVMLVLDATTGQNSISQARLFNEAVDITGLTLTKLDGTAKGGIVVNICHDFNIPIRFIGIGEKLEDLRDFDPQEFIEALFVNGSQQ